MPETDRWGDTGHVQDDSSEGGSSMLWIGMGLLLLLVLAAGGVMFVRMQRMQQVAMLEAMAARAEAEQRMAQAAQTMIHAREQLKAAFFPNQQEAVATGDAVLAFLNNPVDQRDPSEFVGKDAIFYGIGPGPRPGELDMIIGDVVHLRVQIDKSKVNPPETPGWSAFVLGKIVSIDRPTNTITIDVQPENWKLEPPK